MRVRVQNCLPHYFQYIAFKCFLLHLISVCVCLLLLLLLQLYAHGSQKKTCGSCSLFLPCESVSGIKLRLPDIVASSFPHGAILLVYQRVISTQRPSYTHTSVRHWFQDLSAPLPKSTGAQFSYLKW